MKSLINFESVKFNTIVVLSSKASYDWYLEHLYPYYSAVWLYCIEDGIVDPDISAYMKSQIETNDKLNLIIFGIHNYARFDKIATSRILVMDNIVAKAKLLQLIHRSIVEVIVGFCQQWFAIDRIPNKNNWSNIELAKKGDIHTLLN